MTDYVGNDVKADVEHVWDVGAKHFPEMAGAYHRSHELVYQTENSLPPDRSLFLPKWRTLRDCLTTILGTSYTNIEDTATALREAMKDYAARDHDAHEGLKRAMEDYPEDGVADLPPPRVPVFAPARAPVWLQPGQSNQGDASYDGGAPDPGDLLTKARTADEKLYEAATKELNVLERGIVEAVPDSWLGIDFDGSTTLTDGNRAAPMVRIEALMEQAVRSNPSMFGSPIANLESLGDLQDHGDKPFNRFSSEVNHARRALDDDKWGGTAASNFRENFLDAYDDIQAAQVQVVGLLMGALKGYKKALEDTYRMYDQVLEGTITACQAIIDGQSGALVSLGNTVLTATITLAGGWVTGSLKGAASIGFALAGSGASVTSAAAQVGGTKHAQVYVNAYHAIGNYRGALERFDQALARDLQSDTGKVQTYMDSSGEGDIILPRPAFADNHTLF